MTLLGGAVVGVETDTRWAGLVAGTSRMPFTPRGFDTGCEAIVQAFRRLLRCDDGAQSSLSSTAWTDNNAAAPAAGDRTNTGLNKDHDGDAHYPLTEWSIVRRDNHDGASVLVHPTADVPWIVPEREGGANVAGRKMSPIGWANHCDEVFDDPDAYVDESLLADPSVTVFLPDDAAPVAESPTSSIPLEWTFSVAYSHTFQVPVLYFTVARRPRWHHHHQHHRPDGECVTDADADVAVPLSCDEVLRLLLERRNVLGTHDNDDGLEMVSHDEHPVFGTPVLLLHPCRTAERLEALWEGDRGGRGDGGADLYKEWTTKEGIKLLSWMSLILPAVGFGIPARLYVRLRAILLENEEEGELAGPGPHEG